MVAELAISAMRLQGQTCDIRNRIYLRNPQSRGMDVEWIRSAFAKNPEKTQRGLAAALKRDPAAVNRMLKSNRQLKASEIQKVQEYFGKTNEPNIEQNSKGEEGTQHLNYAPLIAPADWPRDLPIFGVAIGGTTGGISFNGEVLGYVRRPPKLQGVKSSYAVYVHGSSMSPWRRNGEAVYVHPGMPCDVGDYVVVQLRPENEGEAPRAFVKELVRRTEKELRLKQFNPPKEIIIPAAKVLAIHRVMDWSELLEI